MSVTSWGALFAPPLFRKAWEDHRAGLTWTEDQSDNLLYIFGRMMAAESRAPLPKFVDGALSDEIVHLVRRCPAFEAQMATAQVLQMLSATEKEVFAGDPGEILEALRQAGPRIDINAFMQEHGVKQGDEKS